MALQDLTPQLRTRLNQMERAVGWFVFLATALLLFGFGYYIYHTAEHKGWFKIRAPFFAYVQSSAGLNIGDKVYMMGFEVGNITRIEPLPPYDKHNVKVTFDIVDPYFRRIWLGGSYVKVNAAGFLDQRLLEVTRGTNGPAICVTQPGMWKTIPELEQIITVETNRWQLYQDVLDENSNLVFGAYLMLTQSNLERIAELQLPTNSIFVYDNTVNYQRIVASWDNRVHRYVNFTPSRDSAWLRAVETPPVSDQLQAMVSQVQAALPNVFALTNKLARRAGQRGQRHIESEFHAAGRAAARHEFLGDQRGVARAGRTGRLGAGHQQQRANSNRADESQFAAGRHRHQFEHAHGRHRRNPGKSRRHHQQFECSGPGQFQFAVGHFQDGDGRGQLCARFEASLAVAIRVQNQGDQPTSRKKPTADEDKIRISSAAAV